MNEVYLIYAEKVNELPNSLGEYEYEFFFSEEPETAWGDDWNQNCPSACSRSGLRPYDEHITMIKRLSTSAVLTTIGENSCFSLQDCVDGIVACVWEDINTYDEYPEPFRIVFKFGEKYSTICAKLEKREIYFKADEEKNPMAD